MSDIDDRHYESVLSMSAQQQYWYFLTEVSVNGEVWVLRRRDDDGWGTARDSEDERRTLFPLWPYRRFAEALATGVWEGCVPTGVEAWSVLDLLDDIEANGDQVALLWLPDGRFVRVEPGMLRDDLRTRLEDEMGDEDDDQAGDAADEWTQQEERYRTLALHGDRSAARELSRMRAEIGDDMGAQHWQRVAERPG